VLVPVYTRFGYGKIDLSKYESVLQSDDHKQIVQVQFTCSPNCEGFI
jgi:hypothetical protein